MKKALSSEDSGSLSQFGDDASPDISQKSNDVSLSSIKYEADVKIKSDGEELNLSSSRNRDNALSPGKSDGEELNLSSCSNKANALSPIKIDGKEFNSSSSSDKDNALSPTKIDGKELNSSSSSNKDNALSPAPSKQKLRNTKRRAGILYRQLKSSKLCQVTSKYFSQAHNKNTKRWIPPRSPYALVQEDLFDNPWQLLVATIFLTKTTAKKALPQLHKFLARYPRPEDVLKANYEDIDEYFKPLGLTTTRSHIIMRFTVEYLEKDWTYPRELYGIGKYGDDSYRMFCINEWRQVSPDDIPLSMYRNWLLENAERLGVQ